MDLPRAHSASWRRLLPGLLALGSGVLACQEDLLQTAVRPPDGTGGNGGNGGEGGQAALGELDCTTPATSDALPPGAAFGEGDVLEPWPLVSTSYGAGEGPGLYVLSRDTFRVYVDGHLVAESTAARTPLFLPLSLLPGASVIAIAAHAAVGAPAVLVQLDDLSASYFSGESWKVSTAPEGGWQDVGFDDEGWANARELGALDGLPGCDPDGTFPDSSTARWIGTEEGTTGSLALRTTIHIEPVGFAEATTGGAGAPPTLVASFDELAAAVSSPDPAVILLPEGVSDFRRTGSDATTRSTCPSTCTEEPEKTTLQIMSTDDTCAQPVVEELTTDRALEVASNKTILGLGRGALLRGVGLHVAGADNVIARNLALYDINARLFEGGDALTLEGASRLWIDHVTAKWVSDAHADVHAGTTQTTLSYVLLDGENEAECGDREHWMMTLTDTEMTIHHSRFEQATTRAPAATESSLLHVYNSVFSSTSDWTVASRCQSEVLLEGSVFENVEAATSLGDCGDGTGLGLMQAAGRGNVYRDGSAVFLGGDGSEPADDVFVPPYEYTLVPATDALGQVVSRAGAGSLWALPLVLD